MHHTHIHERLNVCVPGFRTKSVLWPKDHTAMGNLKLNEGLGQDREKRGGNYYTFPGYC